MRKYRVFILTMISGVLFVPLFHVFAQMTDFDSSSTWKNQWRKEGQLVTVQISRGKPIRIFLVGREEAKIDPSTMSLTLRRIRPYPAKTLSVDKFNNYFVVSDSKEFENSKEIEIVTKVKGRDETFKFTMKQDFQ